MTQREREEKTQEVFKENEISANNFTAGALFNAWVVFFITWLLNTVGILSAPQSSFNWTIAFMTAELIIPFYCNYKYKGNKPWIKNMLLGAAILATMNVGIVLTNRVVLFILFPILLSCHYYSKKLTVTISIITVIENFLSIGTAIMFGLPDYNYIIIKNGKKQLVDGSIASSIPRDVIDFKATLFNELIHGFLPRVLLLFILVKVCIVIAKRTYTMINNHNHLVREDERIYTELKIASNIQTSMAPKILPTFPNRPEFDIAAHMETAKEVGGDFYDFFFVDNDHFAVVIADVSGKGVPASLMMAVTKILIKNKLQNGNSIDEAYADVNRQICDGNDLNMFVTSWAMIIELSTGNVEYVNAGHNPPLASFSGDTFEFIKERPNLVLGAMENTKYVKHCLKLKKGDLIYLYTDGVTEAINSSNEQFGEERLINLLNENVNTGVNDLLKLIKKDIVDFSGEAEQFDDITMLAIRWN